MAVAILEGDELQALIVQAVQRALEPRPASESPWLSVEAAADYICSTPTAVYSAIRENKFPVHRPNGPKSRPVLIARADLDAWVTARSA